jgi:hypothetical protein
VSPFHLVFCAWHVSVYIGHNQVLLWVRKLLHLLYFLISCHAFCCLKYTSFMRVMCSLSWFWCCLCCMLCAAVMSIYQTTICHIPERVSNLRSYRCENLKSQKVYIWLCCHGHFVSETLRPECFPL